MSIEAFEKWRKNFLADDYNWLPTAPDLTRAAWDEATRQAEAREVRLADVLVATVENLEMLGGGNPAGNPALYAICQSIKSAVLRERELAAMGRKP